MIGIDAVWLAINPLDMRAGTDTALARVVQVFGAARPHWIAARRLHLDADRVVDLNSGGLEGLGTIPDASRYPRRGRPVPPARVRTRQRPNRYA